MKTNKKQLNAKLSLRIVECVKECVSINKGKSIQLMDGSVVRLSPSLAKRFIDIHDELSEENQSSFRLILVESKKSFEGVNTFCKEKNK